MPELRVARGWTRDELDHRLAALAALRRTSPDAPLEALHVDDGWREERSEAIVAREPAGPPQRDGAFARACEAVVAFAFSDPTIVAAHFDPGEPLRSRRMLLDLQVLGLHYLCGVEVVEVRDERTADRSAFGFRYDTLEGHLERGGEWFLVTKDHATGEVRLCITSRWRLGDMPNAWTELGFRWLAPYYRALWLHRARERLRALLAASHDLRAPPGGQIVDEGPPIGALPALDLPPPPGRGAVVALGALTGMRSLSGIAVLAARAIVLGPPPGADPIERALARPGAGLALAAAAVGELVADKTPWVGDRTAPAALAGRVVLGAACGALQARRARRRPIAGALLGAAAAASSAVLAFAVRRRASRALGVPSAALGVVEDAVVIAGAVAVWRALIRHAPRAYALGYTEEHRPGGRVRVMR